MDYEKEIIRYVSKHLVVPLKELENYIASRYGVSIKTAYYHISKLRESGILRYRRTKDRKILVELSPSFISYIVELYSNISQIRDRVRYYEKKVE